jgi:antitoxin (DNA-binding transcriptional repressor) of toxin-antitoxin stability system
VTVVRISATALRADIYRVIDHVLATGEEVEIERHGRVVRLSSAGAASKLDRLVTRDVVVGDPDDLVAIDWSHTWSP